MSLRSRAAENRFARAAALPIRAATVGAYDARVLGRSLRWLVVSREHTNFTYDLEPRNASHLAWWISAITGEHVTRVREYLQEIESDTDLRAHLARAVAASPRRRLMDVEARFGRRIGWYALVRCSRPTHVVETGTDKGLGTCVFAAALLRNGHGRLTTIDTNPSSGSLIGGRYADVVDRRVGDSTSILPSLHPVDLFLHDSLHSFEHETSELEAVPLTPDALVLSDNAHATDALARWAERTGRRFLYFQEISRKHWYPGTGIGAAFDLPKLG